MNDTPEPKTEVFIDGLSKILVDLKQAARRDPEAVMLIGSLADRIIADTGEDNWIDFKHNLSDDEHKSIVETFTRQIAGAEREGQVKIAYALQAVATSVVGSRIKDKRVKGGIRLLDDFIISSRDFFRRNAPKQN